MKKLFTLIFIVCITFTGGLSTPCLKEINPFLGMWTLDIEGGKVGWLEVHEKEGFLDANLLWIGGSVLPVGHVYMADNNTLIVTRTQERIRKTDAEGDERVHIVTSTLRAQRVGKHLVGSMTQPHWKDMGETKTAFVGTLLPDVPPKPDLSQVTYGEPIKLFNETDLSGWKLINPDHVNGFRVINQELVNDPNQPSEGEHINYGNLRTEAVFEDFNLSLDVNVPKGNNSGIYLRGMYEIQVFDSFNKELDSHHMGALYSRITPKVSAEKPPGTWQGLDITLYKRHLTVHLNGKTIIDNQPIYGPTGGAILSDVFSPGPIYLQGDHGKVSYRNITLKPILK